MYHPMYEITLTCIIEASCVLPNPTVSLLLPKSNNYSDLKNNLNLSVCNYHIVLNNILFTFAWFLI